MLRTNEESAYFEKVKVALGVVQTVLAESTGDVRITEVLESAEAQHNKIGASGDALRQLIGDAILYGATEGSLEVTLRATVSLKKAAA